MAFRLRDKQRIAWFLLFCFSLSIVLYLALSTSAFATGWMYISAKHSPSEEKWGREESPHGSYTATTNKCRVCHALHKANSDSYRLLFDSSRQTACDRCHDGVTGLSDKKPYRLNSPMIINKVHKQYTRLDSGKNEEKTKIINGQLQAQSWTPEYPWPVASAKGEHTLGVTEIPSSDISLPDSSSDPSAPNAGLNCLSCHDAHFVPENIIDNIDRGLEKDLLRDPGDNNGDVREGLSGLTGTSGNLSSDENEILTAFCGDCHNKSVNWTDASDYRPNKANHPMHTDLYVDIYGQSKKVSEANVESCMSCHSATTLVKDPGSPTGYKPGPSTFPHQSVGHKLLQDGYNDPSDYLRNGGSGGYTGDPYRPLPNMDTGMCRSSQCHIKIGQQSLEGY